MKFCKECDNLLYPVEIENQLYLRCDECGYKEENTQTIIEKKNYKKKEMIALDNNNFTIYDNTLPNTIHKKCPNKNCISNKEPELQNAKIIQDPVTIKLTYKCVNCNTEWSYS